MRQIPAAIAGKGLEGIRCGHGNGYLLNMAWIAFVLQQPLEISIANPLWLIWTRLLLILEKNPEAVIDDRNFRPSA